MDTIGDVVAKRSVTHFAPTGLHRDISIPEGGTMVPSSYIRQFKKDIPTRCSLAIPAMEALKRLANDRILRGGAARTTDLRGAGCTTK